MMLLLLTGLSFFQPSTFAATPCNPPYQKFLKEITLSLKTKEEFAEFEKNLTEKFKNESDAELHQEVQKYIDHQLEIAKSKLTEEQLKETAIYLPGLNRDGPTSVEGFITDFDNWKPETHPSGPYLAVFRKTISQRITSPKMIIPGASDINRVRSFINQYTENVNGVLAVQELEARLLKIKTNQLDAPHP